MLIKISSALTQSMYLPQTILEAEASHIFVEIGRNAAKNEISFVILLHSFDISTFSGIPTLRRCKHYHR